MKKDNTVYLRDMLTAISRIEEYMKNISYDDFLEESMRQDAVIRHLEIIGEAAAQLSSEYMKDASDFPMREAVDMRNFLIHGYDEVDIKVVWKTIQTDIPSLKAKLLTLLS